MKPDLTFDLEEFTCLTLGPLLVSLLRRLLGRRTLCPVAGCIPGGAPRANKVAHAGEPTPRAVLSRAWAPDVLKFFRDPPAPARFHLGT